MRRQVIVLEPDKAHSSGLCAVLEREGAVSPPLCEFAEAMHSCLDRNLTLALFVNLDLVPPDDMQNRWIWTPFLLPEGAQNNFTEQLPQVLDSEGLVKTSLSQEGAPIAEALELVGLSRSS